MSRRVTSWSLSIASRVLTQVFVGDLIEAERWAVLISGGAEFVLVGADGQRSEAKCDCPVVMRRR
ncbi:MAG: hypothetical protein ACO1OB_29680 [Archangium sp.]